MNLDEKINELKEFLKHTENIDWYTNAEFKWKGKIVEIFSYEWCTGQADRYQGKLDCLEELKDELEAKNEINNI